MEKIIGDAEMIAGSRRPHRSVDGNADEAASGALPTLKRAPRLRAFPTPKHTDVILRLTEKQNGVNVLCGEGGEVVIVSCVVWSPYCSGRGGTEEDHGIGGCVNAHMRVYSRRGY